MRSDQRESSFWVCEQQNYYRLNGKEIILLQIIQIFKVIEIL